MTALLRHLASAAGGAILAASLFVGLGQATRPGTVEAQARIPVTRTVPAVPMSVLITCYGSATEPWIEAQRLPPPPAIALAPELVEHPGFDTSSLIDPGYLQPEPVVMSRQISMTELEVQRRWWRSILPQSEG